MSQRHPAETERHADGRGAGETVVYGAGQVLPGVPDGDFDGIWYRFRSFYDPEGNVMHICEVHPPAGFDRRRHR